VVVVVEVELFEEDTMFAMACVSATMVRDSGLAENDLQELAQMVHEPKE